jgi:hypothetical protein
MIIQFEKEFDERFPPKQKEATHFEDCKCWSCNDYRKQVKEFIPSLLELQAKQTLREVKELLSKDGNTFGILDDKGVGGAILVDDVYKILDKLCPESLNK